MFNGRGVIYNDNPQENEEFTYKNFTDLKEMWVKYEGEFENDAKHGIGTLYLANGDKFFGNFSEDLVHGEGQYTSTQDGDKVEIIGEWEKNLFIEGEVAEEQEVDEDTTFFEGGD